MPEKVNRLQPPAIASYRGYGRDLGSISRWYQNARKRHGRYPSFRRVLPILLFILLITVFRIAYYKY